MAASIGKLSLVLSADATELSKDLDDAGKKISGKATSIEKAASTKSFGRVFGKMLDLAPGGLMAGAGVFGIEKVLGLVSHTFGTMLHLGAASNPVAGQRYNDAWADTLAVLGRAFVPVLEIATDLLRLFADVMTTLLPSSAELRDAFKDLREAIKSLKVGGLGGFGQGMFKPWLTGARVMGKAAQFFSGGFNLFGGGGDEMQSSVGAAGRDASLGGISELAMKNWAAAFSGPSDGARMVEEQQKTNTTLDILNNGLQRFGNALVKGGW
jgi:hypothetical protein